MQFSTMLLFGISLCAMSMRGNAQAPLHETPPSPTAPTVHVVRRGWHIDVGFAVHDLIAPLRAVAGNFPGARYLLFGFGDMHYLVSKQHGSGSMLAALWPGRGIMLVTALDGTPAQAVGATHARGLIVSAAQFAAVQEFILNSFASSSLYQAGPYPGSGYFLASMRYSALHTCNTWAAQALRAGGLPIHSGGVVFAGQLWSQVRSKAVSSHSGRPPSCLNPAGLPRWSSRAAADCCC